MKTNCKKVLLLAVLCISGIIESKAQWVVSDPTNLAQGIINMANNIRAVGETTGETQEVYKATTKLYDENKKYYDNLLTVNTFVRDTKNVGRSIQLVKDMSDMFINDFSRFTANPHLSPDQLNAYMNKYNYSIRHATEELQSISLVIGKGLSMTDKDRLDRIDTHYNKINSYYRDLCRSQLEIKMLAERAERKAKQKKMIRELKNRE